MTTQLSPEPAIRVRGLEKSYQELRVLRGVRDRSFVVIASDNVDCFAEIYRRLTRRRDRRGRGAAEQRLHRRDLHEGADAPR